MDAAQTIRQAVARVADMRRQALADPALLTAIGEVKAFQSRRFAGTYADLLASDAYGAATRFFLEDLYGTKDYSERDAQFSRIAGTFQKLFPNQVVATATALAQLHALTETLDHHMALAWLKLPVSSRKDKAAAYAACWRNVGRETDRTHQLETVLSIGNDLSRLTRTHGLRLMLKMMRGPAMAAGLSSLQRFLERGFDIFATMSVKEGRAQAFLNTIHDREEQWVELLSNGDMQQCRAELQACLAGTR